MISKAIKRYKKKILVLLYPKFNRIVFIAIVITLFWMGIRLYIKELDHFYKIRLDSAGLSELSAVIREKSDLYDGQGNKKTTVDELEHYYLFGQAKNNHSLIGRTINRESIIGWIDDKKLFLWEKRRFIWPKKSTTLECPAKDGDSFLIDGDRDPSDFGLFILAKDSEWYQVAYVSVSDKSEKEMEKKFIACKVKNNNDFDEFIYLSKYDFSLRIKAVEKIIASLERPNDSGNTINNREMIAFLKSKLDGQVGFWNSNANWNGNPPMGGVPLELF